MSFLILLFVVHEKSQKKEGQDCAQLAYSKSAVW